MKNSLVFRKFALILMASTIAVTATACNTVKGAGRDIESVGDAADRAL